jgi:hypothetical protein
MDYALSYAAWLSQQAAEINTLTVVFTDQSSVCFSQLDHETKVVELTDEAEEPNLV